jgi:hypothetical protein
MILDKKQIQDLSFVMNRAAHKYAGDDTGAGDNNEMYSACSNWSMIFENELKKSK